jgi:hypothetical protein
LQHASAVAGLGVLLDRGTEVTAALGQAISVTQVVSADVFEGLIGG